jgi:hypothetical protein
MRRSYNQARIVCVQLLNSGSASIAIAPQHDVRQRAGNDREQ